MKMATFDKVDCVEIEPALILITTFDSAFFQNLVLVSCLISLCQIAERVSRISQTREVVMEHSLFIILHVQYFIPNFQLYVTDPK